MAIYASFFTTVLLTMSSVQAATTTCKKVESGTLITGPFRDASGTKSAELEDVGLKPYSWSYNNTLAYYKSGNHPNITAEFQLCQPNYAQWTTPGDYYYGRFYIPALNKCLAVTNPSGAPPYIVQAIPCIPEKDMNTAKSIPFNFFAPKSDDWNNYFWTGATIPSKKVYQGPEPYASNCRGRFSVNATNLQHGHNYGDSGEPSTFVNNTIQLYCAVKDGILRTAETVFRLDDGSHIIVDCSNGQCVGS